MSLRIISCLKPTGTKSFRLSATKYFDRYGWNVQNPDKDTQDIAEAPAGHVIVSADQEGAEALGVAYIARPAKYRALFLHGVKPHTYVAMHLFAKLFNLPPNSPFLTLPVEEFTQLPEWSTLHERIKVSGKPYDIGKKIVHASSYRMGPYTFRNSCLKASNGVLRLSISDCKAFLKMFRDLFPEIVEWQEETELRLRSTRRLSNLFGEERAFEREMTDGYIREGISWVPQSTIAGITHRGVRTARANGLSVCINKHDSYGVICPHAEAGAVGALMQKSLSITLQGRDTTFTMKSEVKVGQNLMDYNAITNPLGMLKLDKWLKFNT